MNATILQTNLLFLKYDTSSLYFKKQTLCIGKVPYFSVRGHNTPAPQEFTHQKASVTEHIAAHSVLLPSLSWEQITPPLKTNEITARAMFQERALIPDVSFSLVSLFPLPQAQQYPREKWGMLSATLGSEKEQSLGHLIMDAQHKLLGH